MDNQFEIFDQYDQDNGSRIPIKKRWVFLGLFIVLIIAVGCVMVKILPRKDRIETSNLPEIYIIENESNYVAYQSGNDCAGYATAYTMRHMGIQTDGAKLYNEFSRFFGRVALHNIVEKLNDYNLEGKAYYGTCDTLKAELLKGVPVIALVKIYIGGEWGLHYVAVVGYDEEYIYMADSTKPKTNICNCTMYNRKLTYSEFEDLWDTDVYPMKNCYIVVKEK